MSSSSWPPSSGGSGSGDVTGPGASVDNRIARFNGTDGKTIQNSAVAIDDSGNVTGAGIDADNNTISNLEVDNLKAGVLDVDLSAVSASDDTIPSAKAVKAYVDGQIQTVDQAAEITYSNATSGLTATDVQAAIDEVEGRLDTAESSISTNSDDISTNTTNITSVTNNLATHEADTANPHSVTAAQVGLSNVDNTSDADKPISTATQTALDAKQADVVTTKGDLVVGDNAGAASRLAVGSDGQILKADSSVAGGVKWAAEEGGSSGVNYAQNSDAEDGVASGISTSANVSVTQETTNVVRGSASFLISATSSATTSDYAQWALDTFDYADLNKVQAVSFDVRTPSGSAYAGGDFEAVIIEDPAGAATEIPCSVSAVPGAGNYVATFVTTSTTTYALRIKVATASTALTLVIDNVKVGPQDIYYGVPQEDAKERSADFTFPASFGSVTEKFITVERKGDKAIITGTFKQGSPTAATAYLELPSDLTIDSSKYTTQTNRQKLGEVALARAATTQNIYSLDNAVIAFYDGSTTNQVFFALQTGNSAGQFVKSFASTINATSGTAYSFRFEIYVAQWAGSSVWLSSALPEFISHDGTDVVYGPQGAEIPTATPSGTADTFNLIELAPNQSTDMYRLEMQRGGAGPWIPFGNSLANLLSNDGTNYIGANVDYDGTNLRIVKGKYKSGGSSGWSALTAGTRWRARKLPGVIQSALPSAIKWQRKELSTSLTASDTDIAELKFSNLTPGRTYRVTAQAQFTNAGGGGNWGKFWIEHDSAKLLEIHNRDDSTDSNSGSSSGSSRVFTATTTTMIAEFSELSASITLHAASDGEGTWVLLEELPYHTETSEW